MGNRSVYTYVYSKVEFIYVFGLWFINQHFFKRLFVYFIQVSEKFSLLEIKIIYSKRNIWIFIEQSVNVSNVDNSTIKQTTKERTIKHGKPIMVIIIIIIKTKIINKFN